MYTLGLAILQLMSKPANSLLAVLLFAIGMGLISFIIIAGQHLDRQATRNLAGIDLVAGAKGSPLQLILSSVLHIDYPTGNIKLHEAELIGRNPMVEKTIPIALGDNFFGYRIVGTVPGYGSIYDAEPAKGRWFNLPMEATIGSLVAQRTGLSLNDTFTGVHGFQTHGHTHDEHEYTVTGILLPTGTVIDKLILTPVESVWLVHDHNHSHDHSENGHHHHDDCHHGHHHEHGDCDHDHDHDYGHDHDEKGSHQRQTAIHEHGHDHATTVTGAAKAGLSPLLRDIVQRVEAGMDISREEMDMYLRLLEGDVMAIGHNDDKEITALLVFYRSPLAAIQLPRMINEGTSMQAASPAIEMNRLFSFLGQGFDTLRKLAWVIIILSCFQIFVQLVNNLRQGLPQMALMRVMGSSRRRVFLLVLSQGMLLSLAGWLTGIVLARISWLLVPALQLLPGERLPGLQGAELILLLVAIMAGMLAAVTPAWKAYRTDIQSTLNSHIHA